MVRERINSEKPLETSNETCNSPKNEETFNEGLIDKWMLTFNKDDTQDSNQLKINYDTLKKRYKGTTPKNRNKKTQFIPNPNIIDYSADTEEFSREDLDEKVSNMQINSIKMKDNNITSLDTNSHNYIQRNYCVTESDIMTSSKFSQMAFHNTPQKMPASFVWSFNENQQPQITNMIHRGSIVSNRSTNYNSNNQRKQGIFEDECTNEFVEYGYSPSGTNDEYFFLK